MFIVDDNDSCLTLVASAFENDYKVLTFTSAKKIFTFFEKMIPDIIFMDNEMPEINGFEAITKIKENDNWKNIPIILMTGWVTDTIKEKANELGVKSVLAKPFSMKQAIETVNIILNQ